MEVKRNAVEEKINKKKANRAVFSEVYQRQLRDAGFDFSAEETIRIMNIFLYVLSEFLRNKFTVSFQHVGAFHLKKYKGKFLNDITTGERRYKPEYEKVKFDASHDFGANSRKILSGGRSV